MTLDQFIIQVKRDVTDARSALEQAISLLENTGIEYDVDYDEDYLAELDKLTRPLDDMADKLGAIEERLIAIPDERKLTEKVMEPYEDRDE